uniref:Serine/threonine protein phosphatase 7 long form isogeny n=1 Tax=Cajanus cajan TaxID=3821 RepID=A0A151SJH3_CAJCA|nr:Serine/threonine protein phosphatase 7 long form isogeny [Cajanus cajan]
MTLKDMALQLGLRAEGRPITRPSYLDWDELCERILVHCKAYIMYLIGGVILLEKSANRVHLIYLNLLIDFNNIRHYSWGLACLATLYRQICLGSLTSERIMGGCALLLKSWAWYCMSFMAP